MVYIILILLAAVLVEAAALAGIAIWREMKKCSRASGGKAGKAREDMDDGEFEKKWQEGVSAMMGYDMSAARRAVRGDGDEE